MFVFNTQCLLFALCCFPRLTVSAWWGVSCPSGQKLDSHIMNSPSYKLLLMVEPPLLPVARVTYISEWWRKRCLVLSRKNFSAHLLFTNSSVPNLSFRLKMEGLWWMQLTQKMAECLASFKYIMLCAHRLWASVREKWQPTWPFSLNRMWKKGIS